VTDIGACAMGMVDVGNVVAAAKLIRYSAALGPNLAMAVEMVGLRLRSDPVQRASNAFVADDDPTPDVDEHQSDLGPEPASVGGSPHEAISRHFNDTPRAGVDNDMQNDYPRTAINPSVHGAGHSTNDETFSFHAQVLMPDVYKKGPNEAEPTPKYVSVPKAEGDCRYRDPVRSVSPKAWKCAQMILGRFARLAPSSAVDIDRCIEKFARREPVVRVPLTSEQDRQLPIRVLVDKRISHGPFRRDLIGLLGAIRSACIRRRVVAWPIARRNGVWWGADGPNGNLKKLVRFPNESDLIVVSGGRDSSDGNLCMVAQIVDQIRPEGAVPIVWIGDRFSREAIMTCGLRQCDVFSYLDESGLGVP
jgi:hypothetical protein